MKKKLLFLSLSVLAIAAVVTVKSVNTKSGMSSLMTQNIEALTQNEQPNVNRCIPAYSWVCIALHPTNPALDIEIINKRW